MTPPFAGYVSGHSTYSRAAAEVMTSSPATPSSPAAWASSSLPQNEFLVFEHPRADDIPGRIMGSKIGPDAYAKAQAYFEPYSTVTITKARVLPRSKGRGRIIVKGRLLTGQNGAGDVLDVANGLALTVSYSGNRFQVGTMTGAECRVRKNGRVRGRAGDKSAKATFKPIRTSPGEYRFTLRLRIDEHTTPEEGPLTVQVLCGNAVREGTAATCTLKGRRGKLICTE